MLTVALPSAPERRSELTPEVPHVHRASIPRAQHGRLLYGSLRETGVRLVWHDFNTLSTFDWSQSLRPRVLALCINLSGRGDVNWGSNALAFLPGNVGFFGSQGQGALQATRQAGQSHQFITAEFTASFLQRYLSSCDGALNRQVERFLSGKVRRGWLAEVWPLTHEQEAFARRLAQAPVFQAGRALWYQGQVLQLMAEFLFERRGEDELFCDRQKRLARERTARVITILQRDLINPPSLEAIGREVGSSPYYLSRIFSQEAGMTIPQYLRKLRMERAAELLRAGKHNVTEAALEVGYSSLSHFSQAFCQTMGCCPGLYPLKNAIRRQ
jgi:AraC-like DNA-binding protein